MRGAKSTSWNHDVKRLPEAEIQQWWRWRETCSSKCLGKKEYQISYDYITGRAGRVSTSTRYVCEKHAQQFAKRYGLPWPPDDSDRQALKA